MELSPIVILLIGVVVIIGMILALRINAFIALITSAIIVSLLSPGAATEKITRVAEAFGRSAGGIGIVIAMAAVIGKCLMDSGAADRIVRSFTKAIGQERAPFALMTSGFVLSVPVFFDTVFYLLIPLARSLWRTKRKNYVLYILAMVAGGGVTHSMVPPTPGPLAIADNLGVDLGVMMLVGSLIAIPMSVVGLGVSWLLNRWQPIEMRPYPGAEEVVELDDAELPPLSMSLLPVLLPVVMIATNTIAKAMFDASSGTGETLLGMTAILGNPSLALLISAAMSIFLVVKYRGHSREQVSASVEQALMSGGVVILITAAGGAFGKMLAAAGIQQTVQSMMEDGNVASGVTVLVAAFAVASLMKFAQGSGTVSMITTSSMFAAMGFTNETLGYHLVYLATAIGSGSMVGDWMNNSGFWVFSKMSVLTTVETLKTWSVLTAALGFTGLVVTVLASIVFPMV